MCLFRAVACYRSSSHADYLKSKLIVARTFGGGIVVEEIVFCRKFFKTVSIYLLIL